MRVHVLQVAYGDDEPIAERRERVAALARAQAGADLVVLPELWPQTGFDYSRWAEEAEPVDGPTFTVMSQVARELGAVVHAGSVIERDADGRLHNTSLLIGADGTLLARYRKIHRFGFAAGEPKLLEAGTDVVVVDVPLPGRTLRVGLATCYDLRFPELFRALLDAGSELVIVPAAWPAARAEAWCLLGRARAIENQTVVVQANTAGTHHGTRMGGRSQVVDPLGVVLAAAGPEQEVLAVDVDPATIDAARQAFPVLDDRRL